MTRFHELEQQIERNSLTPKPMPRYKCHKEVWALKIKEIVSGENESIFVFSELGFGPTMVPNAWISKHNPVAGGYYVVYDDGYESFSPTKAFEDGYTRIV